MEQELISKKELLELTGISYGQLYRWKRKNLIPEEWFIRKSTFTGQETFFPKEQILSRVDKIQQMKSGLSLDELADMFSPSLAESAFTIEDLLKRKVSSRPVIEFFMEQNGAVASFSFDKTLYLYVLDRMIRPGDINLEEARMVLNLLEKEYSKVREFNAQLYFIRKFGVSSCFLAAGSEAVYMEDGTNVVSRLDMGKCIEELKIKLM